MRVHTHFLDNRRYIVRQGDYEADAYTFNGAEEKIRNRIKEALERKAKRIALQVYTEGGIPSAEEKASYELDAYAQLREAVFDLSVPAAIYGGVFVDKTD